MNILVTGGAGYIGSHTAKALARAGHVPVVFDNLSRGNTSAVKWGPLVCGDIKNKTQLLETISRFSIEAVMHFAAYAYVGESTLLPAPYFQNNSVGSLSLIEAASEAGVNSFIFSSTCATYGNPKYLPIDENHSQEPVNPYGESKLFTEKVLRWFGTVHKLNWVALRFFNAAGADPEGDIGECHNPETHLIPLVIESCLNHQQPINLLGTNYQTPDGTPIRDYTHVSDIADAHILALQYLLRGGASNAFNLGTGVGHSVREVIECVRDVTRLEPATLVCPRRIGDPDALIADNKRAAELLKWKPTKSTLREIVETAWAWRNAADVRFAKTAMSGASTSSRR